MKSFLIILFSLISAAAFSNFEEYAQDYYEAQVLVDARNYLIEIQQDLDLGRALDKKGLLELEEDLEKIAQIGCDCPQINNVIKGQAFALIGAINGVIARETTSISHGKKSYDTLVKARQLDPRNVDAIRGQGEALKVILSRGAIARSIVSMTLGINLKKETRQLIKDLRTFSDHSVLLKLADQLQKLL